MPSLAMASRPPENPRTILPGCNLLWIGGRGGAFLRDAGGNIPADAEAVATIKDRGNVGDLTSAGGGGLTYNAAGFGGRGSIAFAGGGTDYATSPSWTLNGRASGIIVWRATTGGARGVWCHGATNVRVSQFWNANLGVSRRIDGAGGLDCGHAMAAGTDFWTSFRLTNGDGETWGKGGVSGTSTVDATIPTSAAATVVGSLAGVAAFVGEIYELVLADIVMTEAQRLRLQAYAQRESGLAA